MEKKNIALLRIGGLTTNFYYYIKESEKYNVYLIDEYEDFSITSYDVIIISSHLFDNEFGLSDDIINKIIKSNKPIIIIYDSDMYTNSRISEVIKEKFGVVFKNVDSNVIKYDIDDYTIDNSSGRNYAMEPKDGSFCFVKNTKKCFVNIIGNVVIMHDVKQINSEMKIYKNVFYNKTELLDFFIDQCGKSSIPEWVNEIKILNENELTSKIEELNNEIKKLKEEKEKQINYLKELEEYKKLLCSSGDELVSIVKKVLEEMLETQLYDYDEMKEDLSFELDGKKILVEVKGINTGIKRENVSQTNIHILDHASKNETEDEDIPKKYKGLLIINPYNKNSLSEKIQKQFYSGDVIKDIKYFDICAIDTFTLLSLYCRFKNGESIDMKKIILETNYNEPELDMYK